MLRAAIYLIAIATGYVLAFGKGPFFALLSYVLVYFIPALPKVHWWADLLPFTRWSVLSASVLILTAVIHGKQLTNRPLRSVHWAIIFVLLNTFVAIFAAVDHKDIFEYSYMLATYAVLAVLIIKIVDTPEQFKQLTLSFIILASLLSVQAYLEGERVHGRLENIGTNDTIGSNEFGLLLAGIMPLAIPFLLRGKKSEKIICVIAIPLILNAFILCNSRGALLSLVIGLVYAAVIVADKHLRRILYVLLVLAIPAFVYLTDSEFLTRVSSLLGIETAAADEESMNELSSGRTEIWKYGWAMVEDHPYGAGPNSFKHLAKSYLPPEILTYHSGAEYGIRAAHNTYLQVLVEQGAAGLVIWIIMCLHTLLILRGSAKKLSRAGMSKDFTGLMVFALNISFVSSLAGGMVGSRVYYEFFWWQLALVIVLHYHVQDIVKARSQPERLEPGHVAKAIGTVGV